MSLPIVLSDDEDRIVLDTPLATTSKKRRTGPELVTDPPVLVIDDDPTPKKFGSGSGFSPSFVAETPLSEIAIVKCTSRVNLPKDPQARVSADVPRLSGIGGMICLGSDSESDSASERETWKGNEAAGSASNTAEDARQDFAFVKPTHSVGDSDLFRGSVRNSNATSPSEGTHVFQVDQDDSPEKENVSTEEMDETAYNKNGEKSFSSKNPSADEGIMKKKMRKEERIRAAEEKKLLREQEKLRAAEEKKRQRELKKLHAAEEKLKKEQEKLAKKAEAAEMKKVKQWEKGKFAQKSIVAEIDAKVVELGSVGGHLLTRLSEKGLSFRIKSNPIERSIVWTMSVPEEISQLSSKGAQVSYIVLVFEAEDFCNLVYGSFLEHVDSVRRLYPSHTVCYLTNRLLAYINKREQEQYKNPASSSGWRRPAVEEELAKLTTHYVRVHSRQCVDEAEVAEHIVGLTSSLASCHFRKKLSCLSVNANGSIIPKDAAERNLMKNNVWLRALVAIPKVQPRFAIAIWKKYPTMKSLMSVYMDPNKSVFEKERLLKDLVTEGLVGQDRRLGEVCSKRVYRILMARNGSIRTDDVEDGADFFGS